VSVTDGRGMTTTYRYDALDRPTEIVYDDGTRVVNVYDANGRRTSRTDVSGTVTTAFDPDGNIVSETYPAPRAQQTYDYDVNGNLTRHTDTADSFTVTYTYDRANRLEQVREPDIDGTTPTTAYRYEAGSNNLASMTLPSSTGVVQTYDYDDDDRIVDVSAVRVDRADAGVVPLRRSVA
jgi:YD repeat-containing protein